MARPMPFGVPLCRCSRRVCELTLANCSVQLRALYWKFYLSVTARRGFSRLECPLCAGSRVGNRAASAQAEPVIRRQVTVTSIKDRGVFFTISFGLSRGRLCPCVASAPVSSTLVRQFSVRSLVRGPVLALLPRDSFVTCELLNFIEWHSKTVKRLTVLR